MIKYIRQGLIVNQRTHTRPKMKLYNKGLLKNVLNMKADQVMTREQFRQEFVKPSLASVRSELTKNGAKEPKTIRLDLTSPQLEVGQVDTVKSQNNYLEVPLGSQ